MTLTKRSTVALIAIILAVALALCLVFYPPLRTVVLRPVVDTWISFRYALALFSERVQWSFAVAFAAFFLVLSFLKRVPARTHRAKKTSNGRLPEQGSLMRIDRLLARSRRNRFAREQTMTELRNLAARVVAVRQGIPLLEAIGRVDAGTWTDDPAARECFQRSYDKKKLRQGEDFLSDATQVMLRIEKMYQEVQA